MSDRRRPGDRSASAPRRSILVLIVLGCVAAAVAQVAVWARGTALDTDGYVKVVAPLPQSEEFSTALAANVADLILGDVDGDQQLSSELSANSNPLPGSTAMTLRGVVVETAAEFISSEQFGDMWERINRTAHPHMIDVVTGESTVASADEGRLVLDLSEPTKQVRSRLDATGIGALLLPETGAEKQLVLLELGQPGLAELTVNLLNRLYIVLPLVALLLLAGALWLSDERQRSLIHIGIGLAISMTVALLVLVLARNWTLTQVSDPVNQAGIAAIWDRLVGPLVTRQAVLLVLSGLVAAVLSIRRPRPPLPQTPDRTGTPA